MADRLNARTEIDPRHLQNPTLWFLHSYWNAKRGLRPMPARSDINPIEMKQHLGWISLLDVLPDLSDFRYRLIGTKVTEYFSANNTGKTVTEAYRPFGEAAVRGVLALFRKVARDKVPVRAWGDANWLGKGAIDFETLYLPLSSDGVKADMLVGAFSFDDRRRWELGEAATVARRNSTE